MILNVDDPNENQPSQPSSPPPQEQPSIPDVPYNPNWDRIEKGQVPQGEPMTRDPRESR